VRALGKSLLGDSLLILESVDRAKLPSLYQAADIFAIASLHEMLPIVLLEALASGLPITCSLTPVLKWVVGLVGTLEDISVPGGLVRQWQRLADPGVREAMAAAARNRAERTFSEPVVAKQMLDMYKAVMAMETAR
jgi:1,2-diacylglycerol 3-alpha-glucosyltransferase